MCDEAAQSEHTFLMNEDKHLPSNIPETWVLLDNQSTVDVFSNHHLLVNIRKSDNGPMRIHTTAGSTTTNLIGDFPGYGTVWFHPYGITNILSLSNLSQHFKITFNSIAGNEFHIHKGDYVRIFKRSPKGLYYHDMATDSRSLTAMDTSNKPTMPTDPPNAEPDPKPTEEMALVNTVAVNKSNYSEQAYSRAVIARRLQNIIGCPSIRHYKYIIRNGLLPNCPISVDDITAAEDIFGPNVGNLKGKTVRKPSHRVTGVHIPIPPHIMSKYRDVTLAGDTMFINKMPFLVTLSRHIRFGTAELLK